MSLPTNLVAHHLKVLQDAGLVTRSRSEGDRRRTYLRLNSDLLATLALTHRLPPGRVVFVCTHNSARSQLAAGLWRTRTGQPDASAGTQPARRVHPKAVTVDLTGTVRPRLHWPVPDPVHIGTDAAFEGAFTDLAARIDRLAPNATNRLGEESTGMAQPRPAHRPHRRHRTAARPLPVRAR